MVLNACIVAEHVHAAGPEAKCLNWAEVADRYIARTGIDPVGQVPGRRQAAKVDDAIARRVGRQHILVKAESRDILEIDNGHVLLPRSPLHAENYPPKPEIYNWLTAAQSQPKTTGVPVLGKKRN